MWKLLVKRSFYLAILAAGISIFIILDKRLTSSPTAGMPVPPKGYFWKLAFDDEFSGGKLDTNKWNTCYDTYDLATGGCTNSPNQELEWYKASSVVVSSGSAILTAKQQQAIGLSRDSINSPGKLTRFPYQSGMIATGKSGPNAPAKWSGSYGYYVIKAKLPAGKGLWPAFWLLPVNDQWPPEIDVMEMLGDNPRDILMTYFWPNGKYPPPKDSTTYTGANYSNGWHTYAVNWQPSQIDWYVDGALRKTVQSSNVPSTPMQIIVDLAVGGKLPGNPDSATKFPQSIQIDYVRVYQLHK